jgi:hypothetical protein
LRDRVEAVGIMLVTFFYVLGVCALLYVSIYLPYTYPLEPRSEITWENLRLWVPAFVWVLIASVAWAVVRGGREQ